MGSKPRGAAELRGAQAPLWAPWCGWRGPNVVAPDTSFRGAAEPFVALFSGALFEKKPLLAISLLPLLNCSYLRH